MKKAIRNHKKNAGFTMIEMFLYMVFLLLIVGMVSGILVWMVRASGNVTLQNELAAGLDHAMVLMANEIREAGSVYTPTTTSTQLSLETQNNVSAGEPSTYIDFFLCATQLCMKREFQNPDPLTTDRLEIQSLTFTEIKTGGVSSIQIIMTAVRGNLTQEARTTVSLRAY